MKMGFAVIHTSNERNSEIQARTGFWARDLCDSGAVSC